MKLRAQGRKPVVVAPVRASAAVAAAYRAQLQRLIEAMHLATVHALKTAWSSAKLPLTDVISDAGPEAILTKAMKKLARQWQRNFSDASKQAAKTFADKSLRHQDVAFRKALSDKGWAVKFQTTPSVEDALDDIVAENVDLIRSIPEKYFEDIREQVLESVRAGRSMSKLTEHLEHVYGVTHRRAALIARDQNNKATALIHRIRQKDVGITKAKWIHTAASVHPREEHIAWDGELYDISTGMYSEEDGEYVWPGTPINCGCTSMSVIPGLEDDDETSTTDDEEGAA